MNEQDLFFVIEKRLIEFGYPKDVIQFEVKTPLGRRADIVVFESDKPKIVVEIKSGDVVIPSKEAELKFHPATRQAQAYAKELRAPYYVVTNGSVFRWFSTDEDGRPKLLQYPILPEPTLSEDISMGKNKILQLMFGLADQSRDILSFDSLLTNLGVSLLSYFENKEQSQFENITEHFDFLEITKLDQDFITKAISIFVQAEINSYPGSVLVQAIDEFLQIYITDIRFLQFKLPSWLTNFMVDLSQIKTSKGFLDIYSNFGDGAVAANQMSHDVPVYSFSFTPFAFLWDRVKRAALGMRGDNSWLLSPESLSTFSLLSNVDRVLVAPPFSGRFENDKKQIQSSEIFFIDKALKILDTVGFIVAIVPEGFLFSMGAEKFRIKLLEQCRLWAIISLEQFLPKTGIKASILVFEKQKKRLLGNVLMTELTAADVKEISSKNQPNKLWKILDLHNEHFAGQMLSNAEQIILIPETELLNNKSWSVKHYLSKDFEVPSLAYPTRNLSELCSVTKGASITLDDNGDIPVIGPSAIRAFDIDPISFDKTSKRKIALAKTNPKYAKQNDILIHAIGPHRGEAALVTSELDGLLVSRHMLMVNLETQEITPEYLVVALNSSFVRKQVYNISTGSVIAGLTLGNTKKLEIPIPPIEEQNRVVEKVNLIQSQMREIKNSLRDAESELETLLDSYYTLGANND